MMNGFLLIDKSAGMTSNDALNLLKKKTGIKKMGHTGTLDPFATGLLVVGLGEALKFIPYLQHDPKVYNATLKLGEKTDTLDLTGKIVETKSVPLVSSSDIQSVLKNMTGGQDQVPPMYSAKKKDGQKLYELARKGIEIERQPSWIHIDALKILRWESPLLTFQVSCSTGTYVRVLGETIAQNLGTIGYLTELRRVVAGSFNIEDSVDPEGEWDIRKKIISMTQSLSHLPQRELSEVEKMKVFQGQPVKKNGFDLEGLIRFVYKNDILGIGEIKGDQLWPRRMISQVLPSENRTV